MWELKCCLEFIFYRAYLFFSLRRADDKTAQDYNLEGGATLHLVLALRGGCNDL